LPLLPAFFFFFLVEALAEAVFIFAKASAPPPPPSASLSPHSSPSDALPSSSLLPPWSVRDSTPVAVEGGGCLGDVVGAEELAESGGVAVAFLGVAVLGAALNSNVAVGASGGLLSGTTMVSDFSSMTASAAGAAVAVAASPASALRNRLNGCGPASARQTTPSHLNGELSAAAAAPSGNKGVNPVVLNPGPKP